VTYFFLLESNFLP